MLEIIHGDDELLLCQVVDPESTPVPNEPVPLTGVTAIKFMVKRSKRDLDTDALLTKTLSSGITITDELLGKFTVTLDSSDTAALPIGRFPYGIQIRDGSNKVNERHLGDINVIRDVVQASS